MKNWKYINGAEVGNEGLSLWEKLKTVGKDHIVMKSADGGEVQIKKDGESWYKKDNQSQIVRDKHSSFDKAVEAYKLHGFKLGNQDGVARMFEGLVKDENKETEKDSGAIEELETGNREYSTADFDIIRKKAKQIAETTSDESKKKRALEIAEKMKKAPLQPNWGKQIQHYEEELKKIGNTSPDDKFAYVMREFDEGKLKSSSGETVTNPEQAKAIAYSESKKAENGIDRAFKAMNKGRINYDDDIVVIKKNGNILYKGMQDYANDENIPWKYNESKGIYEGPDGLTKEKIG